jgi:tartrate dehydratase alpha subunit/fumarate hydratase class I-like protein
MVLIKPVVQVVTLGKERQSPICGLTGIMVFFLNSMKAFTSLRKER